MTSIGAPSARISPTVSASTAAAPKLSKTDEIVARIDSVIVGTAVSAAAFMPAVHAFDSIGIAREAALIALSGVTAVAIGIAAARATLNGIRCASARLAHA